MAFGKKKEPREVEGYMKLTPKSFLIYLAIIVFCIIVIAPLVIATRTNLPLWLKNISATTLQALTMCLQRLNKSKDCR